VSFSRFDSGAVGVPLGIQSYDDSTGGHGGAQSFAKALRLLLLYWVLKPIGHHDLNRTEVANGAARGNQKPGAVSAATAANRFCRSSPARTIQLAFSWRDVANNDASELIVKSGGKERVFTITDPDLVNDVEGQIELIINWAIDNE
jgi:hypothetical protein